MISGLIRIASAAALVMCAGFAQAQPRIEPPPPREGGGGQPQQQPAPAGGLIQGTTLEMTMQMLSQAGFADLKIYKAKSGAQHVAGKLGEAVVSVVHLNCKEGKCLTLMFMVSFGKQGNVDLNYMNAWNRDKLYARLYQDKEGNVFFRMDTVLWDVPPQYITRMGQTFALMLKNVYEYKPAQN